MSYKFKKYEMTTSKSKRNPEDVTQNLLKSLAKTESKTDHNHKPG